jgi:predicted PurR-regulated permease PerM
MMMVAGFIALILNPLVVYLQHRWIRRRGWAVAVVTIWAALVFTGLVLAFGHPLVHGLTCRNGCPRTCRTHSTATAR